MKYLFEAKKIRNRRFPTVPDHRFLSVADAGAGVASVTGVVAATAASGIAAGIVASEIEDEKGDYDKPNGGIFKQVAQTVHLCASFIL